MKRRNADVGRLGAVSQASSMLQGNHMTSADRVQSPPSEADAHSASSEEFTVRDATTDDMVEVQKIYAYHVLHSTATFEETPPDLDEMHARRERITGLGLPYLVGVADGRVLGYCYAGPFHVRSAYRHTVEDTIYLAEGQAGKGLGKSLLTALIERCEYGPWRQMVAVIAGNNNAGSVGLHRSLGFSHAGSLVGAGYKFRQWIDVVLMQRAIGPGNSVPPEEHAV
jgi:phosphinothricin acetyltransferase